MRIRKEMGLTFDDVLLVPQKTDLLSRKEVDLSTQLTPKIKLKIPLISANMDTVTEAPMAIALAKEGGIGMIHRFLTIDQQVAEVKKVKKEGLLVGAAIGVNSDHKERAEALIKANVDVLVIDIAHGHSFQLLNTLKDLKRQFKNIEVIVGNMATSQAAADLIKAGADAVKVGIGPGSLCTTRIVTGAGMPQITAISEVAEVAHNHSVPVIADGGIRYSGDIVKALAAGASTVMIGSMFAACDESPALSIKKDGLMYKITRGMASMAANRDRQQKDQAFKKDLKEYAAEGVEAKVLAKGKVIDLINQLMWGVRSGFSYSGARTLLELWEKAEFIQITQSSLIESHPHNIIL